MDFSGTGDLLGATFPIGWAAAITTAITTAITMVGMDGI